jgi:hypothetical protein
MNHPCDRRSFVKIGAATAWAVGRECFAADAADVKARPMDKVRIGLVGIGSRGTALLGVLLGRLRPVRTRRSHWHRASTSPTNSSSPAARHAPPSSRLRGRRAHR